MPTPPSARTPTPRRALARLAGLLLPVLAYALAPPAAALLAGGDGSMRFLAATVLLCGAIAALAGALGGRMALLGSLAGFVLARAGLGNLSGDGGMWYLLALPCLLVMAVCAAVAALVGRHWRHHA